MTAIASLINHQVRLAARPTGLPTRANWNFTTEPVAEPGSGGVLIKTLYLSLDPAMRGWMNEGKSYIPPVAIGEVMRAGGIGIVVGSKNAAFKVGDHVTGGPGVQEYWHVAADQVKRSGMAKIDLHVGTVTQWLNVLGMPGMTGYFGLLDVGYAPTCHAAALALPGAEHQQFAGIGLTRDQRRHFRRTDIDCRDNLLHARGFHAFFPLSLAPEDRSALAGSAFGTLRK